VARLLKIFTFRTNDINLDNLDLSLKERGIFHRALGFTWEGVIQAYDFSYATSNIFQPFPQRQVNSQLFDLSNENRFPFLSEGIAYYQIVEAFVKDWMENAGDFGRDALAIAFYNAMKDSSLGQAYELPDYSEAAMIDLLSQCIFTVTGYHEVIGTIIEYTIATNRASVRISEGHVEGSLEADLQSHLLTNLITANTGLPNPKLMASYSNFFGVPIGQAPSWERTVWEKFQVNLVVQSARVKSADSERVARNPQHEFPYLDPANFECSVSH